MRIDKRMLENLPAWMSKKDDIPSGWLYVGDDEERYLLGQPGKRNILIVGANPSNEFPCEKNLDPTVRKVRKLITEDGYDGWIMANLYPLRAPDLKNLPAEADKKLLEKNLKVFGALEKSYYIDRVWAAWGDTIDSRFYLGDHLNDLHEKIDAQWYYRGTLTRSGNPRHPLHMKSSEAYQWFAVGDYAAAWRYANVRG